MVNNVSNVIVLIIVRKRLKASIHLYVVLQLSFIVLVLRTELSCNVL